MKLPRDLSGRELARRLAGLGYGMTRQKGSHMRLTVAATETRGEHSITIPDHDELRVGTLAAILDEVAAHLGLTRDELMEMLFR